MSFRSSLEEIKAHSTKQQETQTHGNKDDLLLEIDSTTATSLNDSPTLSNSTDSSLNSPTHIEPLEQKNSLFEDISSPLKEENDILEGFPVDSHNDNDDFDDFEDFDNNFVDAADDEDFGDFDDFEETKEFSQLDIPEKMEEKTSEPTEAELYVQVLENKREEMSQFIEHYLDRMWEGDNIDSSLKEEGEELVSSPIDRMEHSTDILNTLCSRDLWTKLSRDTVFYNPVTGAVGQFQWTRSETNKSYLHALGVTFSPEEKSPVSASSASNSPNSNNAVKARHSNIVDGKRMNNASTTSLPSSPDNSQTHLRSASVTGGLRVVTNKMDETAKEAKKEADQEMELDVDIARAYCELTEETIRVFPDVKLNAMVIELSRLQKQAADYLDNLLDQREQLKMDAETYNDLISCIVGHAQRLHVQSKDASPAMVTKKKKASGTFSNIMRRKTTTTTTSHQSASYGGGVVGVKQQQAPAPKRTMSSTAQIPITSESRRSM